MPFPTCTLLFGGELPSEEWEGLQEEEAEEHQSLCCTVALLVLS